MALSLSFGTKQFWNELAEMQSSGLYWVNADSQNAAYELAGQVLDAQEIKIITTIIYPQENLITSNKQRPLSPDHVLISRLISSAPSVKQYAMPTDKKAFKSLSRDLNRVIGEQNKLVVLLFPNGVWQGFSEQEFAHWLHEISALAKSKKIALLIIAHGKSEQNLKLKLHTYHRALYGLCHLRSDIEPAQWVISWWHNQVTAEANTTYALQKRPLGWSVMPKAAADAGPAALSDDQWAFWAERGVLEGAPPLSGNWQLFEDNAALAESGMRARSATLIFALNSNEQVETLARQIHLLRTQRGGGLKIVVRELGAALRYADQRLLQACGANLVVPQAARLSSFLTLLEDIQPLSFTRQVSDDIEQLLQGRLPTHHKGYLPLPAFCKVMQSIWSHAEQQTDAPGVLISLRPVTGINPAQSMSLCHLRRDGDILSLTERHLLLFLSNCQAGDVEQVLRSLFSLPVDEVFASRTVWHQADDIQSEIRRLAAKPALPDPVAEPQQMTVPPRDAANAPEPTHPQPINLLLSATPHRAKDQQ
ncbi:cellulose biosynthesis protein BcsE [Pseudomonas reactans]|nr:cellulose biosynthesis protein BcsE [Pseudomonas reactans]